MVPVHSNLEMFYGTVEGRQRERQFTELQCMDGEMYVPDRQPHEECAGLLFSMSSIIHDGAQRKFETMHGIEFLYLIPIYLS